MNEWMFNDAPAQSLHPLLGVREKVFIPRLKTYLESSKTGDKTLSVLKPCIPAQMAQWLCHRLMGW